MAKKESAFLNWFGPLLDALRSLGGSGKPREVSDEIANKLNIPDKQREATLASGQSRFQNQVAWARQYLVWEGLLDSSVRGVWTLTEKGAQTELTHDDARKISRKWVAINAEARRKATTDPYAIDKTEDSSSLDESPTSADESLLLELLKNVSPSGFERICARLLRESGFERVTVTGGVKDEGIDGIGILQLNPFVSFRVLFQCKRYRGSVSRAQVGDFRNAMIGRADKGIIITTGTFTTEARREADRDGAPPVELVDGETLVAMFESIELGVKPKTIYEVDRSFFEPYLAD